MAATNERTGEACKHYPVCYTQSILYKLRIEQLEVLARRQEQERCMAHHMQACLCAKAVWIHTERHWIYKWKLP